MTARKISLLCTAAATLAAFVFLPSAIAQQGTVQSPANETPQTISVLWRTITSPLETSAGMHRMTWDLRAVEAGGRRGGGAGGVAGGGRGSGAAPLTGTFTVRLTVRGQAHTQTLTVTPDPRK